MVAVSDVDELGGDSQAVAFSPDAPLDHRADLQLLADFLNAEVFAFEGKGRGTRRDAKLIHIRQPVDQLLGHSIGEVFALLVAADVDKRKNRDRAARRRSCVVQRNYRRAAVRQKIPANTSGGERANADQCPRETGTLELE